MVPSVFYCLVLLTLTCGSNDIFSGLYNPDLQYNYEVYAAAWLIPRSTFLSKSERIKNMFLLEQSSLWVLLDNDDVQEARNVVLTRDFLDYFVEHLSSTTNIIRPNSQLEHFHLKNTVKKAAALRRHALRINRTPEYSPFSEDTIAIIAFSTNRAFKQGKKESTAARIKVLQDIRYSFFEATFWSVYRYIPNIAVAVAGTDELKRLRKANLPIHHLFIIPNASQPSWALPKESILHLASMLQMNSSWDHFKYVYFTECDQILHMRAQEHMHDFLESTDNMFMTIPHRMQTLLLPKNVPKVFANMHEMEPWRIDSLVNVSLVVENVTHPKGSCCDNGRYWFHKNCGNFWHNCPDWGLRDMSVWLKFGKSGFANPSTTAHLGRCIYSEQKKYCNIPPNCKMRIPRVPADGCWEIQNVTKLP